MPQVRQAVNRAYKDDELISVKYCIVCYKIFDIEQQICRERIRESRR